ncbi:hypothetical protein HDU98_001269 [Podochytrium sp. JEL0797]|nr:hypothetical protein HDU98_001269 [Podochytrium sp. JEL0797]
MLFFNQDDVKGLKSYSYKSVDKLSMLNGVIDYLRRSFVATKILNPYWWSVIIEYVPKTVAPNLITLTGFLCVIANVVLLLTYSPDLQTEIPSWMYISFAIGLFAYQSLDAIDGKQARRTGTSSPLGELFDHGCDALNCGFATFLGIQAMGLGQSVMQIFGLYCCLGNFYLSTWEEYYTGVLFLSEFSGPMEGVHMVIGTLIATSIYGTDMWSTPLSSLLPESFAAWPIFSVPLNIAMLTVGCSMIVFNVKLSNDNLQAAIKTNPASAAKAQRTPPLTGLIPFVTLCAVTSIFPICFPETVIFSNSVTPFVIFLTFIFGHQVGSIIVAHISKRKFPMMRMTLPGIVLSVVAGLVQVYIGDRWWWMAGAAGVAYLSWFVVIVVDLCEIFDIYCLTIKVKKGEDKKSS